MKLIHSPLPHQESLEAREVFAKGFEEALTRLHKNDNHLQGTAPGPAAGRKQTSSNNNNNNIIITSSSSSVLTMTSSAPVMTTISTNSLSMSGGTVTYTNLGESDSGRVCLRHEMGISGGTSSSRPFVDMIVNGLQSSRRNIFVIHIVNYLILMGLGQLSIVPI